MGYSTDFEGSFVLDKPLTAAHKAYLDRFSNTRRMKRHEDTCSFRSDPIREAVGLPVGTEGEYFVGAEGDHGQEGCLGSPEPKDVLDHNEPASTQPGLWCQWQPNELGTAIEWNGAEKFYNYIEWITYIVENFIKPWGYVLNGNVTWQGEESDDMGKIEITNNKIAVKKAKITYE